VQQTGFEFDDRGGWVAHNGFFVDDAVKPLQVGSGEHALHTAGGFHEREGFAIGHLVPQYFPGGFLTAGHGGLHFGLQLGGDDFVGIQEKDVVALDVLQQAVALLGKALPVGMGVDLGAQALGDGDGVVFAAAVDDDDLVRKVGALDALFDAARLVHGEDADAQGRFAHGVFQLRTPCKRPHMRASRRGL